MCETPNIKTKKNLQNREKNPALSNNKKKLAK